MQQLTSTILLRVYTLGSIYVQMTSRQEHDLELKLKEQLQLDEEKDVDNKFDDITKLETGRMRQQSYQPKVIYHSSVVNDHCYMYTLQLWK